MNPKHPSAVQARREEILARSVKVLAPARKEDGSSLPAHFEAPTIRKEPAPGTAYPQPAYLRYHCVHGNWEIGVFFGDVPPKPAKEDAENYTQPVKLPLAFLHDGARAEKLFGEFGDPYFGAIRKNFPPPPPRTMKDPTPPSTPPTEPVAERVAIQAAA